MCIIPFLKDTQLSAHIKIKHKLAVGLWNYSLDNRCHYSENKAYRHKDSCNKFKFIKPHNFEISHRTIQPPDPPSCPWEMTKYIIYICINIIYIYTTFIMITGRVYLSLTKYNKSSGILL